MRTLLITTIALVFMGCQHFKDTVGCYEHTDFSMGFVEQFGNASGGGLSGGSETISNHPSHGGVSTSNFRFDQGRQYANETFSVGATVRVGPGSCN